MHRRIRIRISGRVQGVFFRHRARAFAQSLGISGFAVNELDGSVRIEAEGPPEALQDLVAWCRLGPAGSQVVHVATEPGPLEGLTGFGIK